MPREMPVLAQTSVAEWHFTSSLRKEAKRRRTTVAIWDIEIDREMRNRRVAVEPGAEAAT